MIPNWNWIDKSDITPEASELEQVDSENQADLDYVDWMLRGLEYDWSGTKRTWLSLRQNRIGCSDTEPDPSLFE